MILIYDDYNDWWVWVDETDRTIDLSPYFYYEDDAISWHQRMQKEPKDENS